MEVLPTTLSIGAELSTAYTTNTDIRDFNKT